MNRKGVKLLGLSGRQRQFLVACLSEKVKLVVVGGHAVRFHGHMRGTNDLDILVERNAQNLARLKSALTAIGIESVDEVAAHLSREKKKATWYDVDLLSSMKGMDQRSIFDQAETGWIEGIKVPIMSLPHLIQAKRLALADPERAEATLVDTGDLAALEEKVKGRDDSPLA